jgi:hypothetical protein
MKMGAQSENCNFQGHGSNFLFYFIFYFGSHHSILGKEKEHQIQPKSRRTKISQFENSHGPPGAPGAANLVLYLVAWLTVLS